LFWVRPDEDLDWNFPSPTDTREKEDPDSQRHLLSDPGIYKKKTHKYIKFNTKTNRMIKNKSMKKKQTNEKRKKD